ncbi:MAG: 4-hydroxy-3-methylbut-2-enyl diphosphate reductase [Bifidobacteriaceae bacterium]|jgi:4-hydroxy-3-methylbut-2-enyl diphosphate reductase|nr:4-hydroxy-3-methylbut-2-enyl diphosphate reductase [Bifidobacteriaceae bacterium]
MGKLLLAAPRGYCAGVDRAVETVERALELYGTPLYVRKQIVHNKHVVDSLAARGVVFVDELDEVPNSARVVFSAHGVSPAVRQEAERRSLQVIDATCPLVTKVHKEVAKFASRGYSIVLIGHQGHEEVEGTAGEAPDSIQVIDSPAEVDSVEVPDPSRVAWLSQTTLSVDETVATVDRLRSRFEDLTDPPSGDICYATQNRQSAVKRIASQSDVVIVVGSANSSNSVRLVEVALRSGAGTAHRVDAASEINPEWLADAQTVGLTSGASVPESLVEEAVQRLADLGFAEVELVTAASDALAFALPRDLRRDMELAGQEPPQLPHRA